MAARGALTRLSTTLINSCVQALRPALTSTASLCDLTTTSNSGLSPGLSRGLTSNAAITPGSSQTEAGQVDTGLRQGLWQGSGLGSVSRGLLNPGLEQRLVAQFGRSLGTDAAGMGYTAPYRLHPENIQRVIDAALTLVRELVILKGDTVKSVGGGAKRVPALFGLPLGHNSSFQQGPAYAPAIIRESMWCHSTNSYTEKGVDLNDIRHLVDVGNLPIQELRDCGVDDKQLFDAISEAVKIIIAQEPLRPIVMGGDHSVTWPVVRGVVEAAGKPVDILHFDAHPDMYDCFEGNRYSHASGFARIMEDGLARNLLQVGIRSITKEGRSQAKKFGVKQFEMHEYEDHREYLENLTLGEGCAGIYVSIDVDCLDPAFAPGISHHEPGGMSFRDVMKVLHNLKGDIIGADVVEYNPQRDRQSMTAMVAAKFVRELAAKMAK